MSKSMNMLRTRRRDNNVKPNRKLDRKSSRGMIYENEELRLKTININAEVERGQSDIKKLKRENEMLKKEMWCLRDAYDKLDKLIKDKEIGFCSSSATCSTSETESCSTCSSDSNEVETSQNLENVQKTTNLKSLHLDFDHLSVVPEENSTENSDKNSIPPSDPWNNNNDNERNVIKPDQSYPSFETLNKPLEAEQKMPKHFFSPIKLSKSCEGSLNNDYVPDFFERMQPFPLYDIDPATPNLNLIHPISKSSTDLIVKMDNHNFANTLTSSSFSNGGNLEELLNDIESISQDILKLSNPNLNSKEQGNYENLETIEVKPYKSELNVVLMPTPMPLIGFDKYRNVQDEPVENLKAKSLDNITVQREENPFFFGSGNDYFGRYNPDNYINSGILDNKNKEPVETEEKPKEKEEQPSPKEKPPKLSIRRKVSIHFKGKKAKAETPGEKRGIFDIRFDRKTPSLDSKKSTADEQKTPTEGKRQPETPKTPCSDCKNSDKQAKVRKSQSLSPEKHVQVKEDAKKSHKKHKKVDRPKNRRSTLSNSEKFSGSAERFLRERSFSVCTDRSNMLGFSAYSVYDDFTSERERTNSLSSCGTVKLRKMSNMSNFPVGGKIPWCGCWGNGCL